MSKAKKTVVTMIALTDVSIRRENALIPEIDTDADGTIQEIVEIINLLVVGGKKIIGNILMIKAGSIAETGTTTASTMKSRKDAEIMTLKNAKEATMKTGIVVAIVIDLMRSVILAGRISTTRGGLQAVEKLLLETAMIWFAHLQLKDGL